MSRAYDLVLTGGRAFTTAGLQEVDIAVSGGKIAALGSLAGLSAAERLEVAGLTILPGVIDTQVDFEVPNSEDLATGSKAAVLGGVTAVFDLSRAAPATTAEAVAQRLAKAENRARCDHALFVAATADSLTSLAELESLPGVAGIALSLAASDLWDDDAVLEALLRSGRRPLSLLAEDGPRLRARRPLAAGGVDRHPVWHDEESARLATERLLRLARTSGRRLHFQQVSTAGELPLLAANRDIATFELTPQHLTLEAPACYRELGTLAQNDPPIRDGHHRQALWAAIANGLADLVGSAHAPVVKEAKDLPYPASAQGMPAVQTLLPLLLDHMSAGRLSLDRLVDLTSAGPARVFGLAGKGRIAVGYDADFALVDLDAHRRIQADWLASGSCWSPFEGRYVTGWPKMTFLRGRQVMRDGEVVGEPRGQALRFLDRPAGSV
ncbi:MAG: dihydroorotase [Rhodospirillales bacterium]